MSAPSKIIIDAGPLAALVYQKDPYHQLCLETLKRLPPTSKFYTSVSAITEALAVVGNTRLAVPALGVIFTSLSIELQYIQQYELDRVFELMEKYSDLPMDFADGELVVLSERLGTKTIFTLDKTDFSIYRPKHVKHFEIIPG